MKWSEVCGKYPDKIVLVEALETTSKGHIRTIEKMSILSEYTDRAAAWQEYKRIRKSYPGKELYIFHTSKEKAEVIEQFFSGIRGRQ